MKVHEVHIHQLWTITNFLVLLKRSIMLWQSKNYSKTSYNVIIVDITM